MTDELSSQDLQCLAWVAEGCGGLVPQTHVERLTLAGLVRQPEHRGKDGPPLELTPAGLAHVRSSDQ